MARGLAALFLPKEETGGGDKAAKLAAEGLIEAIKSDDAMEVVEAFKALKEACECEAEPEED